MCSYNPMGNVEWHAYVWSLSTKMPATRPVTGEASDPIIKDDPKEGAPHNTPFTMRYDKLVIAVGAYAQSE